MRNYLLILTLLAGLFAGCSANEEKVTTPESTKPLGRVIMDSITPPIVTMLTGANAPTIIKAGSPVIVPLQYANGLGAPNFTNYSVVDGLIQNYVSSAIQDNEGNMWFATLGGLSKYDGTKFYNYSTSNGLTSDFVSKLFIDSKNNIWIGTYAGLNVYDGKSFITLQLQREDKNRWPDIRDIFEDKNGSIWIASTNGLYQYKNAAFELYTTNEGLADNKIHRIIQDKEGNLLFSTDKGVSVYDGKRFYPYTKLPVKDGDIPSLLLSDSKGDIWFLNQRRLSRFNGSQIITYTAKDGYVDENHIYEILEDRQGNYWIVTVSSGLFRFDGENFINYASKSGLPSDNVMSMALDKEGNIWASTQNGASKISYTWLNYLEEPKDLRFFDFFVDTFGNKWIIDRSKGIGKFNGRHIEFYGKEFLSKYDSFIKGFADDKGNIWFTLFNSKDRTSALVKFDRVAYSIYSKEQGVSFANNSVIYQDKNHNIWVVGYGGAIKINETTVTNYGRDQGIPDDLTTLFEDSKQHYWFGTSDSGVIKYDGKTVTAFDTRDGIPDNFINQITQDPLGNIWLATDRGAAKFDGHKFTAYSAADGLENAVSRVVMDSINNSIWFGTVMGLVSMKYDEIANEKPVFQHFNEKTGFQLGFINPEGLLIDKEGFIWGNSLFNNTSGIFRFDYNSFKDLKPVNPRITNIRIDNKNISWQNLKTIKKQQSANDSLSALNEMVMRFGKLLPDDELKAMSAKFGRLKFDSVTSSDFIPVNLVLPQKNNNISFEFSSISPGFDKSTLYQYKLEGYDKEWSPLSSKTEAVFGNMKEGKYTFIVKALNAFGNWSETSYGFRVRPPWHRTWWAYAIYVLALILFFWRAHHYQKSKTIRKERERTQQKELEQAKEIEKAYKELQATQQQLIQSEKMASLGELTAGIAHEIQNPLNFVNNFSEVSNELLEEMLEEVAKGNYEEVKEILNDVKQNLEKINHHGKRADGIVKGMLQHSRSSSGVKEPTDINALADEYLRLAYHGLRAKDKTFNATMKTDFDTSIGNINVIPQDMGRVILNLITNAFYVVNEKKYSDVEGYEPIVVISTKKSNGKVEVSVKDNGNGIPKKVLDKIFQPFFTTKPTGQGTGLGLSLAFDIVKSHGGELKVETREGEGTIFIIQLPIK